MSSENSLWCPTEYERDLRLLNIDALMAASGLEISNEDHVWFKQVNEAVRALMNGPDYDCSHDYEHVVRVTQNAHRLWLTEKDQSWAKNVNPLVIYTAALCHDIGDSKYVPASKTESPLTSSGKRNHQYDTVLKFLQDRECVSEIAHRAAWVAALVSFTCELDDPKTVEVQILEYPELKFVQDADRLDALGPMGLARCAAHGMLNSRRNNTILTLLKLCDNRFKYYPDLMKTVQGRNEADKDWEYMLLFKKRMLEQADSRSIL
ncbi:hypothetical protein GQ44DRAFT_713672 [Phaeosphaeriaceae sp. PMI808]|nr:hypothetical protein GQ44DRAFT_713672 [Phaeosphaeriaceae sp. PMI808]